MNFEACLSLPRDPREAGLIADNLESLARALRDWPVEAWQRLLDSQAPEPQGMFERLAIRTAPAAVNKQHKAEAARSAEAVAGVLRVLWPEARAASPTYASDDRPELAIA